MPNRKAKYILEAEDRTKLALKKAEKNFAKFSKSVVKSMAPIIGVAAGAGMTAFVSSTLEAADALAKTADKLGITTDLLQELNFAAKRSGVSTEQLASNMTAFVKRVGEAQSDTGPLVAFLKKYDEQLLKNIKNSKSQEEALDLIAEAIKNARTATERAAIANAAFSRSGIGMVNMLKDGAAGLDELQRSARDAGAVLDEDLLRTAEEINDKFGELTATVGTKFKEAILDVADGYNQMHNAYLQWRASTEDSKIADLQRELVDLTTKLRAAEKVMESGGGAATSIAATYDYLKKRVAELRAEIKGLIGTVPENKPLVTGDGAGGDTGGDGGSTPTRTKTSPYAAAIEGLQRQLGLIESTTNAEKVLWEIENGRYRNLSEKQQRALLTAAEALDTKTQEIAKQKELSEAEREYAESQEETAQAWRELLNPMEEVDQQLAELDRLLAEGRITWDTYAEGVFHVADAMDDMADKTDEKTSELSVFAEQAARNMQDSFAEFLYDPFDEGLEGMVSSFAQALQRMAADALAASIFEKLFKDDSGDFGGIFGSFLQSVFQFHDGGVVGQGGTMRSVNPLVFAGAPRYHSGGIAGLAPDEVPAILQRGEMVIPRDQVGAQQSQTSIRIINAIDAQQVVNEGMSSPMGDKLVLNAIRSNATAIKQVLF